MLANLSTKDEVALHAARERWDSACRSFLRCEDGGTVKSEKLRRSSAYWWLLPTDHALRILTGRGLEQFATNDSLLSAEAREHLEDSLGGGGANGNYGACQSPQINVPSVYPP